MGERSKFLFTGLLCTGLFLTGCDNNENKIEPKALLIKAIEKMEAIDRYETTQKTVLSVTTIEGDNAIIASDEQVKADKSNKDIFEVTTNIEMTMGEETQNYEIEQYVESNGDYYDLYTKMEDEWEKENVTTEYAQKFFVRPEEIIRDYIEETEDIRWGKQQEIDDIVCDEVIMTFNMDEVAHKEKIQSFVGKLLRSNGLEISDEELLDKLQDEDAAEEITFYIYIDKETGKIVGESWRAEELAKNILLHIQDMEEEELKAFGFSYDSFYKEIDNEVEIEIPDAAKNIANANKM